MTLQLPSSHCTISVIIGWLEYFLMGVLPGFYLWPFQFILLSLVILPKYILDFITTLFKKFQGFFTIYTLNQYLSLIFNLIKTNFSNPSAFPFLLWSNSFNQTRMVNILRAGFPYFLFLFIFYAISILNYATWKVTIKMRRDSLYIALC